MHEEGTSRRNPALKMLESIKENWYYFISTFLDIPMVENNDTTVMLKLQLSGWIIKIFSNCLFTLAFGIRPTSSFHRWFIPPYYLDQYPSLLANNSLSTMDVLPSPSPFPSRLRAISLNSKSSYRKSSRPADDMESQMAETMREHGTPLKVPMTETMSWVSNGATATDDGSGIYGLGASGGSVQDSERERRGSQVDGRRRNGRSNSQHSIFISVDELRMFGIEWIEMQNTVFDADTDAE
ncbi:hypothetical protein BKA69DRAFT_1039497 [Paraphysoderma sedebokerense]|nr:hypothetical protein BKA69DRAFT_1039497 [Paraphysoderma sedebokerense]